MQVSPASTTASLSHKTRPKDSLYYKKVDLKGEKEILFLAMHDVLVEGSVLQKVIEANSLDRLNM